MARDRSTTVEMARSTELISKGADVQMRRDLPPVKTA
jgi:hypothetical protein